MKILLKTMLLSSLSLVLANAVCTEDEAYNKMMILGAEGAERMHAYMKNNHAKVMLLPDYVSQASPYMKKKNYTKACEIYDEVAKKYGIDFDKKSKNVLSMKEIKEDGGRKSGECSLADATLRFLNVSNLLLARGLAKTLEKNNVYHKASEQITSNPTVSCQLTKQLAQKYNVSEEEMMKQPGY